MTSSRGRVTASAIFLLALAVLSASCAKMQPADDPRDIVLIASRDLEKIGATQNAEALADGEITSEEYFAAANRYKDCIREAGIELDGPYLSPVDNAYLLWGVSENRVAGDNAAEVSERCAEEWLPVVGAYLDTHEFRMDRKLVDAVSFCLERLGNPVTGKEQSAGDFVAGETERSSDVERCVIDSATLLYPELPGVTVIF